MKPKSRKTSKAVPSSVVSSAQVSVQPARFAVAILAAGKGTRLKSQLPKVLHQIGGKPLLQHVIDAAKQIVPAQDIFAIVGHEAERVKEAVAHNGIGFVLQTEQRGTGHAIMMSREVLANYDHVLVLSGDAPLIRATTIAQLHDYHLEQHAAMTLLSALPPDPFGYGRVLRKAKGSALVTEIVEEKSLTPKQRKANLREINAGFYAFAVKPLFAHIDRLKTENAHREFYLTDMAAILWKAKAKVVATPVADDMEVAGINTRVELARLDAMLRDRKCHELMLSGVTIFRPETCVIDEDVEVAADTVIEPSVQLLGKTKIGANCRIRSFSVIQNSTLGDNVLVRPGCILDESLVANAALLGPYSHLRPGSDIGEGAHVGNFVETKKIKLGKGSKANHLTYLGDAEIGAGANIGAGTITCNYDGVNKHKTIIGDGVFVGSDTTLVAPIRLGHGSYVGAASCLTEDVPDDALAVARARQSNKEGWAKTKREQMAAARKK
jgi:bifunctional UDP-N-acetylglucosamine pyrophosphorylase / glucosamine-1-phosphate N-acetyltransferase